MLSNSFIHLQTLKEETEDDDQNIKKLTAKLGQVDTEIKACISVQNDYKMRFIYARNFSSCRNVQNQLCFRRTVVNNVRT